MEEFKSQLQNFKLPLLVAKRNKGHNEVLATISVVVKDVDNPEDLIHSLLTISKASLSIELLENLAKEICDDFRIQDLSINVAFPYHLDRTSPEYAVSTFQLACVYHVDVADNVVKTFMGIGIPVRVADIIPLAGKLEFFIQEPKALFFEDLLDYVQKYAGVRIYPKVSYKENEGLKLLMDMGKTPKEYLTIISDFAETKKLGKGGYAKITTPDVYSGYDIQHSTFWLNMDIRYLGSSRKDAPTWENVFVERLARSIIEELFLNEILYVDIVFIIRESIREWKEITDTMNETIKDHGKMAHRMIRESAKRKLVNELQLKGAA